MNRFKMNVAVHLFLEKNDKILLLRRFNTGYQDGNYSVIAGRIDGQEDFVSAIIREAKEEAGIILTEDDVTPIQVMHRKKIDSEYIDYFFHAKSWKNRIENMEPDKCDELSWYNKNELPTNIIPYIRAAIMNYSENKVFTKFGWE